MSTQIFIQARMSSRRFPGKMLEVVYGQPLIDHIVGAAVKTEYPAVVLTSDQESDDPLAVHCEAQGYHVFRGDLENVFLRFQKALADYPCEHVVRLCGDSPYMSTPLLKHLIEMAQERSCDFLSNTIGKTFPKGQSVEILKSNLILDLDAQALSPEEQEHVTPYFHAHKDQYKTLLVDHRTNLRHINMCIDEPADVERLADMKPFDFNEDEICLSEI